MLSSTDKKLLISADVIFVETEPYFIQPYLQRETSIVEDKDDFFLLDLPSSSPKLAPEPKLEPSSQTHKHEPFLQLGSQTEGGKAITNN